MVTAALFALLGTPPQRKKRLVFPGGHPVPRTEMIKGSLLRLDRYLMIRAPRRRRGRAIVERLKCAPWNQKLSTAGLMSLTRGKGR